MGVDIFSLGQAGFRLTFPGAVLYIDPYLSDYVSETFGEKLKRLVAVPIRPSAIADADWVLITHAHADHADPHTISALAKASPLCRFICPHPVYSILIDAGVSADRIQLADEDWVALGKELSVRAVPAAHLQIERDQDNRLSCVGYLVRHRDKVLYHSGDTIPHPEIFAALDSSRPIDIAMLPVNERNYYRDAAGIVGNMSVREALQMARDLGAATLVPIHWDLFAPNSTPQAEVELIYEYTKPPFELRFIESGASQSFW